MKIDPNSKLCAYRPTFIEVLTLILSYNAADKVSPDEVGPRVKRQVDSILKAFNDD